MLRELYIKNFGIFAEERLQFENGMTVLSGETGAGKSLVVGAISLMLGARASAEHIRGGCEEALIEAVFDLGPAKKSRAVRTRLEEMGFAVEDETLVMKRLLQQNGRGRNFINNASATVAQLATIGELLLDLSGQHEQQILLDDSRHLGLLDVFAGHGDLLKLFRSSYAAARRLQEQLATLEKRQQTAAERADFLRFRVQELERLELHSGEDDEIRDTLKREQNSQRLFEMGRQALDGLNDGEGAVTEKLGAIRRLVEKNLDFDPSLKARLQEIHDAEAIVVETVARLQTYLQQLTFDPGARDKMEERLFKLSEVTRKYGSLQAAVEQMTSMRDELNALDNVDGDIHETTLQLAAAQKELQKLGAELSQSRKTAAGRLNSRVEKELSELAMEGARFAMNLTALATGDLALLTEGFETARALFSANRGEELKALSKVASGGELSRLLLAIKLVLRQGEASTFIFDEIDAGVGGRQAEVIGRKMQSLVQGEGKQAAAQVFCVTHLAPIAAYGHFHLLITKKSEAGRTVARVSRLNDQGRQQEVARMLAGERITDRTLAHAQEMLQNSGVS